MRKSLYRRSKSVPALDYATRTAAATVNGTAVDRYQDGVQEFRSVMFSILAGTVTDGTHTFVVEDSADNVSWGAAAATDVHGTAPTLSSANDATTHDVGYVGTKRYVRLSVTTAGATTGGDFGAVAVLHQGDRDR